MEEGGTNKFPGRTRTILGQSHEIVDVFCIFCSRFFFKSMEIVKSETVKKPERSEEDLRIARTVAVAPYTMKNWRLDFDFWSHPSPQCLNIIDFTVSVFIVSASMLFCFLLLRYSKECRQGIGAPQLECYLSLGSKQCWNSY